jgi:NAD(P)-dependent dehydrogenase (short-subunit alcohol dehydrogenase family)
VVVAGDVREDLAEEVVRTIRDGGGRCESIRLDVTDENGASLAIEKIGSRFGRLDVFVNNAGVDLTVPVDEMPMAEWDRILAVNLRGPFLMSKLALAPMRRQGRGHIVNIVSTAAKRAWANASAYHASKWGLLGLSHALHVEARPHNIKVTAVVAGGMRTPWRRGRPKGCRSSTSRASC